LASNAVQLFLIKSFKHKGLERFFQTGDMRGIQAQHAPRLERLLDALDSAAEVEELNVPGWFLRRLKGDLKNLWSVRVSGNWRLTFVFQDGDAKVVNLEDYH
jgi:toxin HigB-1